MATPPLSPAIYVATGVQASGTDYRSDLPDEILRHVLKEVAPGELPTTVLMTSCIRAPS